MSYFAVFAIVSILILVHELGHGDDREDHRLLGEDDREVDEGGERRDEAEGQEDAADDGGLGHADGAGGLDLARRHGAEAGAEDLGEVGAAVDGETEDAGGERVEAEADHRAAVV